MTTKKYYINGTIIEASSGHEAMTIYNHRYGTDYSSIEEDVWDDDDY